MAFPTNLSNLDSTNEIQSATINNIEAKVGIDNSAVATSLDYMVRNSSAIDPGHHHSKLYESDNGAIALSVDTGGIVTIVNSLVDPILIGGTGTTSTLRLRSTSGVGAAGADIIFQVGNNGATEAGRITNAGLWLIGATTNANMTVGLTINQGANDNEIISFKSSDVAHGMTVITETDTYGLIQKLGATSGGVYMRTLASSGSTGFVLEGIAVTDDTTKSTSGVGYIRLLAGKKGTTNAGLAGTDANLLTIENWGTARFIFDAEGTMHSIGATYTDSIGNGLWFINDTSNANMTTGLTINQGAADNHIFALKSSDVAHGMTTLAETDTFGYMAKNGSIGGLWIEGLKATGLSHGALYLVGALADAADTTHTTGGYGVIRVNAGVKSGTDRGAIAAGGNLFSVENNASTNFIVCSDSLQSNFALTEYDEYDDLALARTFSMASRDAGAKGFIDSQFDKFVNYNEKTLINAGLLGGSLKEGGLVNITGMIKLHNGALGQVRETFYEFREIIKAQTERITQLESKLELLTA